MNTNRKLLVVDVAALGWDFISRQTAGDKQFSFKQLETVFPAVTCPVQASFRTGLLPHEHGIVSNGLILPELRKVSFWEQSATLVHGPRIWADLREADGRVGMMFWQQSLGEDVDLLLSPKPVHKHHGGMIQDCFCQPLDLYAELTRNIRRPFNLMHYWGPLASHKSSDWITAALKTVMYKPDIAPDLLLGYLPHLDYDLQRYGPGSKKAHKALLFLYDYLDDLRSTALATGYDYLFFGDYAIEAVTGGPVFPNLRLREAGLFFTHHVNGMAYPDFFSSTAFCMVDHQVGHVFVTDKAALPQVREALDILPGVASVSKLKSARQVPGSSISLVLTAKKGYWFAYPWWTDPHEAPDYASHVDIHNKPGYDPCELFFGWPPPGVSRNPDRIRGTHGRDGPGTEVAWTSSLAFPEDPTTLPKLARAVQTWFDESS